MATKAQLCVFTKYYKGEAQCPEHIRRLKNGEHLWDYERDWVNETLNHSINGEVISEYIRYTHGKVPSQTGYPISLLAYLFHRMSKWCNSLESLGNDFIDFLNEYYFN